MLFVNITDFWKKITIFNILLLPISAIWMMLSILRKFKKKYNSSLFVICIGNINLGGSGKTPTAITISKALKAKNYRVCFLNSGYKGTLTSPTLINNNFSPKQCGEEALLLSYHLPTCVSKNRVNGLKYLEKLNEFDMVIVDDGYQNPTFHKDYNILVVNGSYGFGNQLIFPAGPLRQTIKSGLKMAHSLLILEDPSQKVCKQTDNFKEIIFSGKYLPINKPHTNDNYFAFCGIGLPDKFFTLLKKSNIMVRKTKIFKDHHLYSAKEIENLINISNTLELKLITTEKDYVKIPNEYKNYVTSFNIELVIDEENKLINNIVNEYKKNS